jgi:hypothetical protein
MKARVEKTRTIHQKQNKISKMNAQQAEGGQKQHQVDAGGHEPNNLAKQN